MFIPPAGLYFRVVDLNEYVLYSRNGPGEDPEMWHFKGPKYEDQLFSLIYGSGFRKGTYAIKGKESGKVLFSRNSPDPRVGHIEGDGKDDDNWFQFPAGSGTYAGKFRILCPANQLVWVSRHDDPQVWNHPAKDVFSDQFFTFGLDDIVVKKIEYDITSGKIVESSTFTLSDQTIKNTTDKVQELPFSFTASVTQTSMFESYNGVQLASGTEVKTGLPIVSGGKFIVDGSATTTWHFGPEESFVKTYADNLPIKVQPSQSVHAVATVQRGMLEVPYTVTLVQNGSGVETQVTGTWKGVSTWNLRYGIDFS